MAPFVYIQRPHSFSNVVLPTVQVGVRCLPTADELDQARLIQEQISLLQNAFEQFDVLEATTQHEVCGLPANYINSDYVLYSQRGSEYWVKSKTWTVFDQNMAFTIGMSGPGFEFEGYELEEQQMFDSILIGTRNRQTG